METIKPNELQRKLAEGFKNLEAWDHSAKEKTQLMSSYYSQTPNHLTPTMSRRLGELFLTIRKAQTRRDETAGAIKNITKHFGF